MRNTLTSLLIALLTIFASCNKDDSSSAKEPEEPTADHTIIMYGCGGGNLDEALLLNLSEVAEYGYSENVNFTALLKFSVDYQDQYPGTRQFTLGEDGFTDVSYSDANFELDNPENLGKFIAEAKASMPAKKYTLIFWNHGDKISADDLPYTKAVCYDDNNAFSSLSIFDIESGLDMAGGVDLVYFDVCLMNMIEYQYQLRDQADYVLGAAHLTNGFGGNYLELMNSLEANADIADAMKQYVPRTGDMWRLMLGTESGFDLTLIDLSYMDQIVGYIGKYADKLIEFREGCKLDEQNELAFYYYNGDSSEGASAARYSAESVALGEDVYYYTEGGVLYTYPYSNYSVDMLDAFAGLTFDEMALQTSVIALKYLFDSAMVVNTTNVESGATCDVFSVGVYNNRKKGHQNN